MEEFKYDVRNSSELFDLQCMYCIFYFTKYDFSNNFWTCHAVLISFIVHVRTESALWESKAGSGWKFLLFWFNLRNYQMDSEKIRFYVKNPSMWSTKIFYIFLFYRHMVLKVQLDTCEWNSCWWTWNKWSYILSTRKWRSKEIVKQVLSECDVELVCRL